MATGASDDLRASCSEESNAGGEKATFERPNGNAHVPNGTAAAENHVAQPEKQADTGATAPAKTKKPNVFKRAWIWLEMDVKTLMMMFKGSLPPTIAIAMYQSNAVADQYTTLGYLIAIMAILGFCIMPRGKFIQTMSANIFAACFGAAFNTFCMWTSVRARVHTTPADATPSALPTYNASQSTVCGIWLFFQVYCINIVRASRPQFTFPAVIYSIFAIVSMSYGPLLADMAAVESIIKRLLESFLTGFALCTAVSLLVFPVSSRTVVFKEMGGYLKLLGGVLKTQTAYMHSLEDVDPVLWRHKREEESSETPHGKHAKMLKVPPSPLTTPASAALKGIVAKLLALHGKLNGDITPAKRDFAYGHLDAKNISELFGFFRVIFVPVLGITAITDILERRADEGHWDREHVNEETDELRQRQLRSLHWTMQQLREPFANMTTEFVQAFTHVALVLGFEKQPKTGADEESKGDMPVPGSPGFTESFRKKVDDFYASKPQTLRKWCDMRGIILPDNFFDDDFKMPEHLMANDEYLRELYQRNLFFVLYLEYLLWRTGCSILQLLLYVDGKKQDGTLSKKRFIFPGKKRLYKLVTSMFTREDVTEDGNMMSDMDQGRAELLDMGEEFARRKDPEHLPPQNWFERVGEKVRMIPKFLSSNPSKFGLRVACATMSIAIVGYLRASQMFFIKQRLLWAEIMIAISMNRLAGQSTFNFVLRVTGTTIAMVGAYIIWYIVDGHTAGIIVFLWLWMTLAYYVVIKMPKFVVIGLLSVVTSVLIVGYELQVRKIGTKAATTNGQPAYPIYELAPYRLACVAGGLFVAWIWTIFPFPISEGSEIRKDLGAAIYLLANLYSITHETIGNRIRGTGGDANVKGTHMYHLDKARSHVMVKALTVLSQTRANTGFSKFQVRVGGKFPAKEYQALIACCQRILNYTIIMSYASRTYTDNEGTHTAWSNDFRQIFGSTNLTSHEMTSLLTLLSSALINGQPLPPYMQLPQTYHFVKKLQAMDADILSIRHIAEPEYSALAVMQICARSLSTDVVQLTKIVQSLVGVMDFSFHAVKSQETRSAHSAESVSDSSSSSKGKLE